MSNNKFVRFEKDCKMVNDSREIDFLKICRTCMSTGEMKPLYGCKTEFCVVEKLMQCTFVEFFEKDGLPTQICQNCIDEIDRSHKFALKCEESDQKLRKHLHELVDGTQETYENTVKIQTEHKFNKYNIKDAFKLIKKSKSKKRQIIYNAEKIDDIEHEVREFSNIDSVLKYPKKFKTTKNKLLIDTTDLNNQIKQGFVGHEIDYVSNRLEVCYGSNIFTSDSLHFYVAAQALPMHKLRKSPGFLNISENVILPNTKQHLGVNCDLNKELPKQTSDNINMLSISEEREVSPTLTILNKDILVNNLSEDLVADPLEMKENQNASTRFKNNLNLNIPKISQQNTLIKLQSQQIPNEQIKSQLQQHAPMESQPEQIKSKPASLEFEQIQNAQSIMEAQQSHTRLKIDNILNIHGDNPNFPIIEHQSTSNQPKVGQQLSVLPYDILLNNEITTPADSIKIEPIENEIENKIDLLDITIILNPPIQNQSHEDVKQLFNLDYDLEHEKPEIVSEAIKDDTLKMECSSIESSTIVTTQIKSEVSDELKIAPPQISPNVLTGGLITQNKCQIRLKPISALISNKTLNSMNSHSYLMSTDNIKSKSRKRIFAKNICSDDRKERPIIHRTYENKVTAFKSPNPRPPITKTYQNKKLISHQNNIYNDAP